MKRIIRMPFGQQLQSFFPVFTVFLVLTALLFSGVRKQTQSFHFEDETDHVTMGWMMNRFDKKLYTDLSTNHQPLPVLAGAVLTRIVSYGTLFDLVEHLRLSMFVYGAIWGVIVAIRFKWRGVFSYALTYSIGYYFFAWHVLAESLAAPMVMFLLLMLFEKSFYVQKSTVLLERIDGMMIGLTLAGTVETLLPLWPFCFLAGLGLIYLSTTTERKIMILTGLLGIVSLMLFFSPTAWFRETVMNNVLYFLPSAPKLGVSEWLEVLFYPFLSMLKPFDRLSQVLLFPLLLTIVITILRWWKQKEKTKKTIFAAGYFYLLLIITNPRVYTFPIAFYQGFHLFPFTAAFFALSVSLAWKCAAFFSHQKVSVILGILFAALFLFNTNWARRNTDKLNEYYVQYGTQDSYARLLTVFKADGDTFFSGPNGFGYMNMRADLPIAGRQLFHLPWAYASPQLREEFHQLMVQNPPTFIYLFDDESGYHTDLQPILKEKYTEIIEDKHRTFLFFLNSKVTNMTEAQKKYLEEKNFHFRTAKEVEIF